MNIIKLYTIIGRKTKLLLAKTLILLFLCFILSVFVLASPYFLPNFYIYEITILFGSVLFIIYNYIICNLKKIEEYIKIDIKHYRSSNNR